MEDDDDWQETTRASRRKSKRVKREHAYSPTPGVDEETSDSEDPSFEQAALFLQSAQRLPGLEGQPEAELPGFDVAYSSLADELWEARRRVEVGLVVRNEHGHLVRPLSQLEADQLVEDLLQKQQSMGATVSENILLSRLGQRGILKPSSGAAMEQDPLAIPLETEAEAQPAPAEVLEGLYSIKNIPFECSFASRLYGGHPSTPLIFFQDWETMSPWMELMADIMDHHRISYPADQEHEAYSWAPITYTPIYAWHLPQVHDLLGRTFWPGIDVSESAKWEPEQCSIIALYKKLVVGCAFLSETMDPYVTYITVRAGWENSGIATFMLYHLIKANPNHDITLHVSATNPAMLLYNRFGFKAEEFVVGFYDDYLDDQTKLCKNALRLRYRR